MNACKVEINNLNIYLDCFHGISYRYKIIKVFKTLLITEN